MGDVLAGVAAAGYQGVEGWLMSCATEEQAREFRQMLDERGLTLTSLYSGLLLRPGAGAAEPGDAASRGGHPASIGCPAICMEPADVTRERKSDDALKLQAEWLNRVGAALRQRGLGLWIHNHDPEMREDGRELRSNLDRTDPDLVGFCADTHWIYRGGGNVMAYLDEYRLPHWSLHLRNSQGGVWSETLGDGDLDNRAIAAKLARSNSTAR